MRRARGIGLAEVLISLFLASLLLVMVTQHYAEIALKTRHFHALVNEKTELLQVVTFLRERIRNAGFLPCVSLNRLSMPPVKAVEVSGDTLILRSMSPNYQEAAFSRGERLSNAHFADKPVIIADCLKAEVQTASARSPLTADCTRFCHIGELLEERFYVKRDSSGSKALMYAASHPEVLTNAITGFKARIIPVNGLKQVEVVLTLLSGQTLTLNTRVRA